MKHQKLLRPFALTIGLAFAFQGALPHSASAATRYHRGSDPMDAVGTTLAGASVGAVFGVAHGYGFLGATSGTPLARAAVRGVFYGGMIGMVISLLTLKGAELEPRQKNMQFTTPPSSSPDARAKALLT